MKVEIEESKLQTAYANACDGVKMLPSAAATTHPTGSSPMPASTTITASELKGRTLPAISAERKRPQ